eukprot:COSAG02_NODE_2566_length_8519_cov_3.109857_7_plen_67_part_00
MESGRRARERDYKCDEPILIIFVPRCAHNWLLHRCISRMLMWQRTTDPVTVASPKAQIEWPGRRRP